MLGALYYEYDHEGNTVAIICVLVCQVPNYISLYVVLWNCVQWNMAFRGVATGGGMDQPPPPPTLHQDKFCNSFRTKLFVRLHGDKTYNSFVCGNNT